MALKNNTDGYDKIKIVNFYTEKKRSTNEDKL